MHEEETDDASCASVQSLYGSLAWAISLAHGILCRYSHGLALYSDASMIMILCLLGMCIGALALAQAGARIRVLSISRACLVLFSPSHFFSCVCLSRTLIHIYLLLLFIRCNVLFLIKFQFFFLALASSPLSLAQNVAYAQNPFRQLAQSSICVLGACKMHAHSLSYGDHYRHQRVLYQVLFCALYSSFFVVAAAAFFLFLFFSAQCASAQCSLCLFHTFFSLFPPFFSASSKC